MPGKPSKSQAKVVEFFGGGRSKRHPIPSQTTLVSRVDGFILEKTSGSFDHLSRNHVIGSAGHEGSLFSEGFQVLASGQKKLRSKSPPPKSWRHSVSQMAAKPTEEIIEFVAHTASPDNHPLKKPIEHGVGNTTLLQIPPMKLFRKALKMGFVSHPFRPNKSMPAAFLSGPFLQADEECRFIVGTELSNFQGHGTDSLSPQEKMKINSRQIILTIRSLNDHLFALTPLAKRIFR